MVCTGDAWLFARFAAGRAVAVRGEADDVEFQPAMGKVDLLMNLLVLEAGELRIPRRLREAGVLIRELNHVEVRHRPGGSLGMGAEGAGEHDDLVIAVALACWRGTRKENSFGTQRLPEFSYEKMNLNADRKFVLTDLSRGG